MKVGRSVYMPTSTPRFGSTTAWRVAGRRVLEGRRDAHELRGQLPRQHGEDVQIRQVRQELTVRGRVERSDADHFRLDVLTARLNDPRLVTRDLAARRHLALDLDPHPLELGRCRRPARGRELPHPLVTRRLTRRRRELRGDQRLLQDRRSVVGRLPRQTEHLGETELHRFVAQLVVQVVDAYFVGGIRCRPASARTCRSPCAAVPLSPSAPLSALRSGFEFLSPRFELRLRLGADLLTSASAESSSRGRQPAVARRPGRRWRPTLPLPAAVF